jgi:hypothetical protein
VKIVKYEEVQTATICMLQGHDFGNKQNPCFILSFYLVVELTIKSQLHFVFYFGFGFTLKIVLGKQNK